MVKLGDEIFICEHCHKDYSHEAQARRCELQHKLNISFFDIELYNKNMFNGDIHSIPLDTSNVFWLSSFIYLKTPEACQIFAEVFDFEWENSNVFGDFVHPIKPGWYCGGHFSNHGNPIRDERLLEELTHLSFQRTFDLEVCGLYDYCVDKKYLSVGDTNYAQDTVLSYDPEIRTTRIHIPICQMRDAPIQLRQLIEQYPQRFKTIGCVECYSKNWCTEYEE